VVRERSRRTQRGATTLVTVMVLFFVMALVAAYANRNLIVEQRIAQSYQLVGYATEANQQAVAHMLSLLNSGNINDQCVPDAAGAGTLRQRLLAINAEGSIDGVPGTKKAFPVDAPFVIACDRERPGNWQCQCPSDFALDLLEDQGKATESFLVRLRLYPEVGNRGRLGLSVLACATASKDCEAVNSTGDLTATWRVQSLLLLRALKMPPTSPLIASGDVDLGTGMSVVLNEAAHGNVALQAGGVVSGNLTRVRGPAGSPASGAVLADVSSLVTPSDDQFFRLFFGMGISDYVLQPAMRRLECEADCTDALKQMVDSGIQMVWHEGDLSLDANVAIGTLERPVLLVVRGALTIAGPIRLTGIVVSTDNLIWTNASADPSLVQGALLVAGNVQADQGATALFDGTVINALKVQAGSFIPLPGGSLWEVKY
jgi:hypothetical protein